MGYLKLISHSKLSIRQDFEIVDLKLYDQDPRVNDLFKHFFVFGVQSLCLGIAQWIREDSVDLFVAPLQGIINGVIRNSTRIDSFSQSLNAQLIGKQFFKLSKDQLARELALRLTGRDKQSLQTVILVLHNLKHVGHAITLQSRWFGGKECFIYFDSSGINVDRQEIRIGFGADSFGAFIDVLIREIQEMNRSNALGCLRSEQVSVKGPMDAIFNGDFSKKKLDKAHKVTDYQLFVVL